MFQPEAVVIQTFAEGLFDNHQEKDVEQKSQRIVFEGAGERDIAQGARPACQQQDQQQQQSQQQVGYAKPPANAVIAPRFRGVIGQRRGIAGKLHGVVSIIHIRVCDGETRKCCRIPSSGLCPEENVGNDYRPFTNTSAEPRISLTSSGEAASAYTRRRGSVPEARNSTQASAPLPSAGASRKNLMPSRLSFFKTLYPPKRLVSAEAARWMADC